MKLKRFCEANTLKKKNKKKVIGKKKKEKEKIMWHDWLSYII